MTPTPGYVFKDGGIEPDCASGGAATVSHETKVSTSTVNKVASEQKATSNPVVTPQTVVDTPTDSHVLAQADHEIKGAVQKVGQNQDLDEVADMGWHAPKEKTPTPLVGGLSNDELWMLVRRFDKQILHVRAVKAPPLNALDLNIADTDEFSPDKLRSNVERLYMTVIIGVIGIVKHIARLRGWGEPKRTSAFCAAYFIGWAFNFLIPLVLTTIIVLITVPSSRYILFPPAPLALVDSKTGGVQSPRAGVLGSHDSATGAPEKHKGEAVEQEADNFVSGIANIALTSAVGKNDHESPESDPLDEAVPDPTNVIETSADAKTLTAGGTPTAKRDKTKQPMKEVLWNKTRPVKHILGDIADGWERFGNALSPTQPFPQQKPRLKLASVFMPLLAISMVTPSAVFMKITSGLIGLIFFSDPLLRRGLKILNEKIPDWQKHLELRNSLLKGVPTNAQLTITLLRIGEANKAPLPPPPRSNEPPSSRPASIHEESLPLATNPEELHEAIHKNENNESAEAADHEQAKAKHKPGQRILSFFKGTTHAGVDTKFNVDKVRAYLLQSANAKDHLGVLPKDTETLTSGPVDFKARFKGGKGYAFISTRGMTPMLSFAHHSTDGAGELATNSQPSKKGERLWTLNIEDITEMKKIGGLGWKTKIIVGWATGKQVADGLEISTKDGRKTKLTAVRLRDELFNRLVSIGGQRWETW